ncbi:cytochrome C [Pelomonas sp. Root1217]|uniref:c-type cytochrome n=1 Tax=Pelomonas sp. Root1217 TaxID=1736430 RepID=UPI00070FA883|nr:c-type cytochrome [Pelomonas sp. Root1217]KQV47253.1 cytochrome C [Pelomonas sp. Root1217]
MRAAWLLATAALAAQAQPVPDTLAQRALACTGCHGKEGRAAPDGYYPRLAGKPAGYLYNQLLNFRDGRRDYGLMSELIAPLSDAYLQELAGHFASLDLPYSPPQKPGLPADELARAEALVSRGDAARRLPACTACHGERLTGTQPAIPGLLGLSRDYLNGQLGAWRSGQRRARAPDCMAQIAKTLTEPEINAITQFLAGRALPADPHPAPTLAAPPPLRCGGLPP